MESPIIIRVTNQETLHLDLTSPKALPCHKAKHAEYRMQPQKESSMQLKGSLTVLSLVIAIGALTGCNSESRQEIKNKAVVRAAFDDINRQDFDSLKRFISENYQRHSQATPGVVIKDYDTFIALIKEWYTAFPDAVQTIKRLSAEGDLVAFQATFEGTHQAPMNGIPATGKKVTSEAFGFHRLENGKIVETWVTWDNLAVLTQLGAFPPPTPKE